MKEEINKSITAQNDFYKTQKTELFKTRCIKGIKILCVLIILFAVFLIISRSMVFIKKINIFSIDNLIVKGNTYLSFNDIAVIMNIKPGDNIFKINLKSLKKKLESHPRVKIVYVKRELPDKVIIDIVERTPLVLLNCKSGLSHWLYEVDKNGYVIGEYPNIYNYDLPVLTGDEFGEVFLGEQLTDITVLNILKTLSGMEKKYYDFKRIMAEIHVSIELKTPDITVYLDLFNTKVLFGEKFTEDKLNKLNSLLMVLGEKVSRLEYIDFKHDEAIGKYSG